MLLLPITKSSSFKETKNAKKIMISTNVPISSTFSMKDILIFFISNLQNFYFANFSVK
jgi:hypothetical protein